MDTSNNKKIILEKLAAVAPSQAIKSDEPILQRKPLSNLVEAFNRACTSTLTEVVPLPDDSSLLTTIIAQMQSHHAIRVSSEYLDLDWEAHNIQAQPGAAQKSDVYALTGVDCAIAATGTLMLCSSQHTPQSLAALPQHHIAVVHHDQLVERLSDAFQILQNQPELCAQTVFISGPSRTADIEQTLVVGAHGPLKLTVILIAQR